MNETKVDELRQLSNDFAVFLQNMEPMTAEQAEDVHDIGIAILCKMARLLPDSRLLPKCGVLLCERIISLVTDAPFESESQRQKFLADYSQSTAVEIAEAIEVKSGNVRAL